MQRRRHHSSRLGLRLATWAAALCVVLLAAPGLVRSTDSVDLVLVLALDTSHSVDAREFELQRDGLAGAFRHPTVTDAILSGRYRRIAVAVTQWAGEGEQAVSVPWTVIASHARAHVFADRIAGLERRYFNGSTYIAGAIEHANQLSLAAPFAAARRVVDISGDGMNTVGNSPHDARDAAQRTGLTINGLAITNEMRGLAEYYRLTVIAGPDAFVIAANDYEDYARAILEKLRREIAPRRIM